jgi:hypothetical protein
MMSRPSEAVAGAVALCQWIIVAIAIPGLPAIIPTHFGLNGRPDATGPASTLWIQPAIGTALYLFLSLVQRKRPPRLNLPVTITDRNRDGVYALAQELLSVLKACLMLVFFMLEWGTVNATSRGMVGPAFFIGIAAPIVLLLGVIAVYTLKMRSI